MSSEVDNRVVSMTFDNGAFASKMAETIKGLEKLQQSLKMTEGVKGMSDVSSSMKNFDVSPMEKGISGISTKWLAMGAVAIGALAGIGMKVADVGVAIAKQFAIGPITAGFKEYETNMTSVQTIMANTSSKGTTLDDVNGALDQLNTYSDQTIYNFGEMAKNIGTFTAAGVGLDDSVRSIKGIANIAALSGSTSEQASTAMYQLSQALASGSVKLMDWNSVVNAGMGGEVFQKALFESGKAMKTIKDVPMGQTFEEWKKKGNSFRDSLKDGWITAEVLNNTLAGFTGDMTAAQLRAKGYSKEQAAEMVRMGKVAKNAATEVKTITQLFGTMKESLGSGWSASFRSIIGDFGQSKSILTAFSSSIGGIISKSAEARNDLLAGWEAFGGRNTLIQGIVYSFKALVSMFNPIKLAFRTMFPKNTVEDLLKFTNGFRDLAERMRLGMNTTGKVFRIFRGVFAVLKLGIGIVTGIGKVIGSLFKSVAGTGDKGGILSVLANLGDMLYVISSIGLGPVIENFFKGLAGAVGGLGAVFSTAIKVIGDFAGMVVNGLVSAFHAVADAIRAAWPYVKAFFMELQNVGAAALPYITAFFKEMGQTIENFAGVLRGVWDTVFEFFANLFGGGDAGTKGGGKEREDEIKKAGTSITVFAGIMEWATGLLKSLSSILSGATSAIGNTAGAAGSTLMGIGEGISSFFSNLWASIGNIASSIGDAMKSIGIGDWQKTKEILTAGAFVGFTVAIIRVFRSITKTFDSIQVSINRIGESVADMFGELGDTLKAFQLKLKAEALKKLAVAIAILAASIFLLSIIDKDRLSASLGAMAAGFGALMTTMIALDKLDVGGSAAQMYGLGLAMVAMAAAVLILAVAMNVLARLDNDELIKGVGTIVALLGGLGLAGKMVNKEKGNLAGAAAAFIGMGIAILILSFAMKSMQDMDMAEIAKGLVGVGIAMLVMSKTMGSIDEKQAAKKGIGFAIIAFSLKGLADVIMQFGELPFAKMLLGVFTLALVMSLIVEAMNQLPPDMPQMALGLALVVASLYVLAGVIEHLGGMSWEELVKGLGAIAVMLGVLAVALLLMNATQAGAYALLTASGAILVLAAALTLLGQLSIGAIIASMLAIVGVFGIIAAAAILMTPIIPLIALLGLALIILGGGLLMFGLGAYLAATAMVMLAGATKKSIDTMTYIFEEFAKLLPRVASALAGAVLDFFGGVLEGIPDLIGLVQTIGEKLLEGLTGLMPRLFELLGSLLDGLIMLIEERGGPLIEAGYTLFQSLLESMRTHVPAMAMMGIDILTGLLDGLANGAVQMTTAGLNLIFAFMTAIGARAQDIVFAGLGLLMSLINGVIANLPLLLGMVTTLIVTILNGLGSSMTEIAGAGIDLLVNFIAGIGLRINEAVDKGAEVVGKFLEGLGSAAVELASKAATVLVDFLNGLATAIEDKSKDIRDAGKNIAKAILGGITGGFSATDAWNSIKDAIGAIADKLPWWLKKLWKIKSPSRVFMDIAKQVPAGIAEGLKDDSDVMSNITDLGDHVTKKLQSTLASISTAGLDSVKMEPVIAPVLDLTGVATEAAKLGGMLGVDAITPEVSTNNARLIALASHRSNESAEPQVITRDVTFTQINNSPKALSTADIYRQTRAPIARVKEELDIA